MSVEAARNSAVVRALAPIARAQVALAVAAAACGIAAITAVVAVRPVFAIALVPILAVVAIRPRAVAAGLVLILLPVALVVEPVLGLTLCLLVAAGGLGIRHHMAIGAAARRVGAPIPALLTALAGALVLLMIVALVAVNPPVGLTAALATVTGAVAVRQRRAIGAVARRVAAPIPALLNALGGALALLALVALLAVDPRVGLIVASAALTVAVVLRYRTSISAIPARHAIELALGIALTTVGAVAVGFGIALWPAATLLILGIGGVLAISVRSPINALMLALLLFFFGGSIKIVLVVQSAPLSMDPAAFGAVALDVGVAIALAALLLRDRGQSLRDAWTGARHYERVVLGLIPAWLLVSIAQIPQSGDLLAGLHGFRLDQAYVGLALAGMIAFRSGPRRSPLQALMVVILVVCAYAAVRTATGPLADERDYVTTGDAAAIYGTTFRAVGSFQSAVALASFLTPAFVFSLVTGFLLPRWRVLGWSAAALALVGIVGSYVRVSLVAAMLALLVTIFALALGSSLRQRRQGRRLIAVTLLVVVVGGLGVAIASRSSRIAEQRAHGLIHPGSDSSLNRRFDTWRNVVATFRAEPFGKGLGTAGRATAGRNPGATVTTDNSFLLVLLEQGVLGTPLFVAGVFGICAVVALRLRRVSEDRRRLGMASLAAFLSFMVLWSAGEYIEQPGKVLAWLLLGVAVGQAFLRSPASSTLESADA